MAFILALKPSYITPVKVFLPDDKGGFEASTFKAEFKRTELDELDALRELSQREALQQVLVGWDDLLDAENRAVEFNEANLAALLKVPQAVKALSEAFWSSVFKSESKN